eukprot:CAMPEP_0180756252 /NCGR_PEP_ID=MMETSP1038_2-20121128/34133_1 /TAXON_ID=632150 /ORGANISM="Azadinium spinosum, Strain 3D9" /LENGTH=110 /DNA_ID=CAMNT_0022790225 /DNA_START=280 /DNA_END=609 /DNA_ORIENTATION=-
MSEETPWHVSRGVNAHTVEGEGIYVPAHPLRQALEDLLILMVEVGQAKQLAPLEFVRGPLEVLRRKHRTICRMKLLRPVKRLQSWDGIHASMVQDYVTNSRRCSATTSSW